MLTFQAGSGRRHIRMWNWLRHFRHFVACPLLLTFAASAQAPLDIRMALVIGNSAYAVSPLPNAANDARDVAATLKQLGFTVVEIQNGNRDQMNEAIIKIRDSLRGKQAVGMLYYAGHGLQLDWRNYMVPVGAKMGSAADVPTQAVDVNAVIDAFKAAGNRMNILVLDACRDNPFGNLASGKGLAQLDAPPGTMLAYSTAPGNVAEDGDVNTGNGLYTQFLLAELKKPNAKIEEVFKRVRYSVRRQSQGRQIPWESTSLDEDFVFNSGQNVVLAKLDARAKEQVFDREKADWDKVKDSKNPADLYAFLQKYPAGFIAEIAQAQLDRLDKGQIVAQAGKDGAVQIRGSPRFRIGDVYEHVSKDTKTGATKQLRTTVTTMSEAGVVLDGFYGPSTRAVYTMAGAIISDSVGLHDPPYTLVPGTEFQVGKRWVGRSVFTTTKGRKGWVEVSGQVLGRESIEVPAGKFDAYKIQSNYSYDTGERWEGTLWMQPDWGVPIKAVWTDRSPFSQFGASGSVKEMVSRKKGITVGDGIEIKRDVRVAQIMKP